MERGTLSNDQRSSHESSRDAVHRGRLCSDGDRVVLQTANGRVSLAERLQTDSGPRWVRYQVEEENVSQSSTQLSEDDVESVEELVRTHPTETSRAEERLGIARET